MKIASINICDNGSTGKIMLDIFNQLDDSDEKLAFVRHKYGDNDVVQRINTTFGYRVHKLLSMYFGLDEWGNYFATKKVVKELRKFKPDILHLHNIHNFTINYRILFDYIKKDNVKVVWTLHDCWSFTGGCFYFDKNNCDKWKTGCEKCKFLKSAGMVTNIDATHKLYKIKKKSFTGVKNMTIVTPSNWLTNLAKQSFLKEYNIVTINNGINLDNFYPQDNHKFDDIVDRSKKILLGVAMPFDERKGYDDFIKLSELVDSNEYQIVMVGLNDQQIQSLPNGIVGIKRTDNQKQLAELYSIAYAFLNLTYEDNFPTVNIEALSCGAPVICYKTGGATEMLSEDNAIVVDKGDYAKIVEMLKNIAPLRNNNAEWIDKVKKHYSSKRMALDYCNIYKEMMGKVERSNDD